MVKAPKKNYDLLDVVMVCLGQKKYTELTGLLRLLNMALLDKLNGSEKRRIMATEFNIEITPELENGVDDMCVAALVLCPRTAHSLCRNLLTTFAA
jgi:hypothetical protein